MNPNLLELIPLAAEGIFYILLLVFVIHVFFVAYHWFSYGTTRAAAAKALAVYLVGAALLIGTMAVLLVNIT